MLQLYSDLLHRKKPRLEAKMIKVLDGGVNNIYMGLTTMLQDNPLICARTEMVWSCKNTDVQKHKNTDCGGEHVFTITELFEEALESTIGHADMTGCLEPHQYKILHLDQYLEYIVNVLNPLFGTIEINRIKLAGFYKNLQDDKLWKKVQSDFLSFRNFVEIYTAEGFIQLFLRGDASHYPKVLNNALEDAPVLDDSFYAWPFKPALVWKTNEGGIGTSLPITKFWKNFSDKFFEKRQPGRNELPFHCIQLIKMYEEYNKWMKTPSTATVGEITRRTKNLYENLCFAMFQKVLAINKKFADNEKALEKIWDKGYIEPHQHLHILGSKDIYKIMTTQKSVYQVLGLVQIHNFVELLRTQTLERLQGGFRLGFSACLDNLMIRLESPFLMRLPSSAKQYVFAPVTFSSVTDTVVDLYRRIFHAKYERSVGTMRIRVTQYLRPFLNHLAGLHQEKEGLDISSILDVINQLLDGDQVRGTAQYKSLGSNVQRVLYPDHQEYFAVPCARPPLAHQYDESDLELESDMEHYQQQQAQPILTPTSAARVTRSVTKKILEDAERKKQLDVLLAQHLDKNAQKQFDDVMADIFSPPPVQNVSSNRSSRIRTTNYSSGSYSSGLPNVASNGPINVQDKLVPYSVTPRPAPPARRRRRISSGTSSEENLTHNYHKDTPRPEVPTPHGIPLQDGLNTDSSCDGFVNDLISSVNNSLDSSAPAGSPPFSLYSRERVSNEYSPCCTDNFLL